MTIVLTNITNCIRSSPIPELQPPKKLLRNNSNGNNHSVININKQSSDDVSLNSVDLNETNRFTENLLNFPDTLQKKSKRDNFAWNSNDYDTENENEDDEFFDSVSSPTFSEKASTIIKVPASRPFYPKISAIATENSDRNNGNRHTLQSNNRVEVLSPIKSKKVANDDLIAHSSTFNSLISERPLNDSGSVEQPRNQRINDSKQDSLRNVEINSTNDTREQEEEIDNASVISERPLACLQEEEEEDITNNTTVRFNEEVSYFDNVYYEEEEEEPILLDNGNIGEQDENADVTETLISDQDVTFNEEKQQQHEISEGSILKGQKSILDDLDTASVSIEEASIPQLHEPPTVVSTSKMLYAPKSAMKATASTITTNTTVGNYANEHSPQKSSETPERSKAGTIRSNNSNSHSRDFNFVTPRPPSSHKPAHSSMASLFSQPSSHRSSSASTSRRYSKYQNNQLDYFESTRHSMRRIDVRRGSILRSSMSTNNININHNNNTSIKYSGYNMSLSDTPNRKYCGSVRADSYNIGDCNSSHRYIFGSRRTGVSEVAHQARFAKGNNDSKKKETKQRRKISGFKLFRSFTHQGITADKDITSVSACNRTTDNIIGKNNNIDFNEDARSRMTNRSRMSRFSNTLSGFNFRIFSTPQASVVNSHEFDQQSTAAASTSATNAFCHTNRGVYNHHLPSRFSSRSVSRRSSSFFLREEDEDRKKRLQDEELTKRKLNGQFFNTVESLKAHYQPDVDYSYDYHSSFSAAANVEHKQHRFSKEKTHGTTIFWNKIKHLLS